MKNIQIAHHSVGPDAPPFIVAEMSGNHNQSLDRALAIVEAAAAAGAHAIKLQTYTADTMTLAIERGEFVIQDAESLWNGQSLHQLYQKAYTPWEWHAPLFARARALGLVPFSTPFDASAVDLLESLNAPVYKIASFENTHLPLIRRVAQTCKPIIVSTGMASLGELEMLVKTAKEAGCKELILLKCTSTYPSAPTDTHLRTIPHLQNLFPDIQVGLSDHTMGVGVAIASVALGATVIEKHFTLRRADGGVDSAFSIEPEELHTLVIESHRAWEALGQIRYGATTREEKSKVFRRSIYVSQDIAAGEILSEDNIRIVRPGLGLPPRDWEQVLGRRARHSLLAGTALQWNMLE